MVDPPIIQVIVSESVVQLVVETIDPHVIEVAPVGAAATGGGGGAAFSAGMSSLGNTSGVSGMATERAVFVGGNNVTLEQSINAGRATVSIHVASQSTHSHAVYLGGVSAGSELATSGVVVFQNSNDVTFGMDDGTVTVAFSQSTHSHESQTTHAHSYMSAGVSTGGNTDGATGLVAREVVFVGGNNITLNESINGQSATIEIIGAAGGGGGGGGTFSAGVSTMGNTAGDTGMVTNRMVLVGSNLSLSQSTNVNGATVSIIGSTHSHEATHSHASYLGAISAGAESQGTGTVVFSNSNNVTFGMDDGTVTATATFDQTTHAHTIMSAGVNGTAAGGSTAGDTGLVMQARLALYAGSNILLSASQNGVSGSITVVGSNSTHSHATVPVAATSEPPPVDNFGSVGTQVSSFALPDHVHPGVQQIGVSTQGNTAGSTLYGPQQVLFVGGNSITLSMSTSPGLATLSIIGPTIPVQSAEPRIVSAGISGGNTSGHTAFKSGALALAGGDNVTLSGSTDAAGITVTVSAASQTTHVHSDLTAGFTNVGNTAGDRGLIADGRVVLAGGNNVTLSGSTNGSSMTISIVGQNTVAQSTQPAVASAGISGGNTLGNTGLKSGSIAFAGGNSITLSGSTDANGETISIIGPTVPVQSAEPRVISLGISGGNTSGQTGFRSGSIVLAGGNNITLSGSTDANGASVTISAFNQSVQPVPVVSNAIQPVSSASGSGTNTSRFAADDHVHAGVMSMGVSTAGGTSGNTGVGVGQYVLQGGNNMTLSQVTAAGGLRTIIFSAGAGGAGAGFTAGMSNLGNTAGTSSMLTKQMVLVGGNNVTLSGSTNSDGGTITISGAAIPGPITVDYWQNFVAEGNVQTTTQGNASLFVAPLTPFADVFPGVMSAQSLFMNVSNSVSVTAAATLSMWLGIYTLNGTSTLSLLNSALSTYTWASNQATSLYQNARWLPFASSIFSTDLTFSQGSYFIGVIFRSSGQNAIPKYYGAAAGSALNRQGVWGVGATGSATSAGWHPWVGVYSASTTAMPASIGFNQLSKNQSSATYAIVPQVILNNLYSNF